MSETNFKRKFEAAFSQLDKITKQPRFASPNLDSSSKTEHAYLPDSLDALLIRISTFKLASYSSKPHSLCPASVALHGYINSAPPRERIECITCHEGLIVIPPSSANKWHLIQDTYTEQLKEKHKKNCPWRIRSSDATLYEVPLKLAELTAIPSLAKQFSSSIQLVHPVSEALVTQLNQISPANTLILPLFGWNVEEKIVQCAFCSRRTLVDNYMKTTSTSRMNLLEEESKVFDVLEQHFEWCAHLIPEANGKLPWEHRLQVFISMHPTATSATNDTALEADSPSRTTDVYKAMKTAREILYPVGAARRSISHN